MRVFVDTNVLIDVLVGREPFAQYSSEILSMSEYGEIDLYTSAVSLINCLYICRKAIGYERAIVGIGQLRKIVKVSPITEKEFDRAIGVASNDLEDATQYFSAISAECDVIVSRDKGGFVFAEIPVYTPMEFLTVYEQHHI